MKIGKITLDESNNKKYQKLNNNKNEEEKEVELNYKSDSEYDSINLKPNLVHIFNDIQGFTAAIVILNANKDIVYNIFSSPENYVRLSPNIVYISFKDESKTIVHSKVHVDLTFMTKKWLFWNLAETVDAIFSWESTQYEVLLKINHKNGSEIKISHHIESHPLGTQVITKVHLSKSKNIRQLFSGLQYLGPCSQIFGYSLQKQQTQLLLNLKDYVQDKATMDAYREQFPESLTYHSPYEC